MHPQTIVLVVSVLLMDKVEDLMKSLRFSEVKSKERKIVWS